MKSNDSLLARVNDGYRPMKKFLPLRFLVIPLAALVAGAVVMEQQLILGLVLAALALILVVPFLLISLSRVHAYEREYLESLDKDALLALVGKEMSYQSKFSTPMVLQTLERRFPDWRASSPT